MEEKIIKWSSKKIIWTILLCLVELAFLLWILSFMMTNPKEAAIELVALRLFILFLIIIVGWLLYERMQILLSGKEYLKFTTQGFFYKPHPKKESQFYSWGAGRNVFSYENQGWKKFEGFSTTKQSNVLKIPIYLLDVGLPRRVFETMSYYEREWRIEQNRQGHQKSKFKSKSKKKERFY